MKTGDWIFALFVATGLALHLGLALGYWSGVTETRNAAVKAGVARWEADPATGEATFVYVRGVFTPCQ